MLRFAQHDGRSDPWVVSYCSRSDVLDAADLKVGGWGSGSSRSGPRYEFGIELVHVLTDAEVQMVATKMGGRTRTEARRDRELLYRQALDELERRVREARPRKNLR